MRRKCDGCRYSFPVDIGEGGELMRACVYILRRGRKRPCPPGEACTVYESAVAEPDKAPGAPTGTVFPWGEKEQRNGRALPLAGEARDVQLATTTKGAVSAVRR